MRWTFSGVGKQTHPVCLHAISDPHLAAINDQVIRSYKEEEERVRCDGDSTFNLFEYVEVHSPLAGRAVVLRLATSDPPPVSLTPIHDTTSPATDGAKNCRLSSSLPNLVNAGVAISEERVHQAHFLHSKYLPHPLHTCVYSNTHGYASTSDAAHLFSNSHRVGEI